MLAKILRWLMFGVVVSLLPLVYSYGDLALRSQPATLAKVIGNGELLVVIWVLSATALGELLGSGGNRLHLKIISGGLTFIIILLAALFFSSITEARANSLPVDEHLVVEGSLILYGLSLVPCVICMACSEPEP